MLYVYQQSEILRLAYVGQKNQTTFQVLLDKNNILRYAIEKNISLVRLGGNLGDSSNFNMPNSYRLVRLSASKENSGMAKAFAAPENLFVRLFGVKRQAEARTINPSGKVGPVE